MFRFLHVSTDEGFGALGPDDQPFLIKSPNGHTSPYAASTAAADHLVHAWHRTYGLPTLTAYACNNYGPRQFPEKLIPLITHSAIESAVLPVYGDGSQRREWLHVDDHARALRVLLENAAPGAACTIGSGEEKTNLEVVTRICSTLDAPRPSCAPHDRGIAFVEDRPGHDFRYALAPSELTTKYGWRPRLRFDEGLAETVLWYLSNPTWLAEALERRDQSSGLPRPLPRGSSPAD